MFLVRLIYVSRKTDAFKPHDIEDILEKARKNNDRNQVTGLLCFSNDIFLQCLEGSRTAVNLTYHNILKDPRHGDIVLLNYKEIIQRNFTKWSMGYIPDTSLTKELNTTYSGSGEFDPFEMHGDSCENMLNNIIQRIPVL